MKVLVLSHMFPNKVSASYGVFVLEQLKSSGEIGVNSQVISPVPYSSTLISFNKKWFGYTKVPKEETVEGLRVYHPRYLSFPKRIMFEKSGFFYYLGIKKVLEKVRANSPIDLIHAHTALPDGQAALYIKKNLNISYILTIHGEDLQNTICQGDARKKAIEEVIVNSEKTIVVSSKLKQIISNEFPEVSSEKVIVINNGVNLSLFKSTPKKFPTKTVFKMLSVGNLIKIKGHNLVLDILPKLLKEFAVKYIIVGDGPERPNLERVIQEKNLSNAVTFLGKQPHQKIPHFMEEANLFVLPSWKEGFGVVYLEALASGLPIIGCKGQGVEDIFKKNKNVGFLVEPKDKQDLYLACRKILSDEKLYEEMSKNAVTLAKKFGWEENAKKTISIYKASLTGGKN